MQCNGFIISVDRTKMNLSINKQLIKTIFNLPCHSTEPYITNRTRSFTKLVVSLSMLIFRPWFLEQSESTSNLLQNGILHVHFRERKKFNTVGLGRKMAPFLIQNGGNMTMNQKGPPTFYYTLDGVISQFKLEPSIH